MESLVKEVYIFPRWEVEGEPEDTTLPPSSFEQSRLIMAVDNCMEVIWEGFNERD